MEDYKQKVDLKTFEGAPMYTRYIKFDQPGVCVTGELDVTHIYKLKKKGYGFNALMCYAIMCAGQNIKEFHYQPKEDGLYFYKNVKVNSVVEGNDKQLYFADYKYADNFKDFFKEYKRVNEYCQKNNCSFIEDTGAMLSTSAVINFPFESFSLGITKDFTDHYFMWGKFIKKGFKVKLKVSLRFHHATIDGQRAGLLFNELQKQLNTLKV